MRTIRDHLSLCSAACMVLLSGLASAQEGVVRISDQPAPPAAAHAASGIRPVAWTTQGGMACGQQSCGLDASCCVPQGCTPDCCAPQGCTPDCGAPSCCAPMAGCAEGCCMGCGNPGCRSECCQCLNCCCHGNMQCGYVDGYRQRMNCLFAGSACSGTGNPCHDFYRGQALSFAAKNARLADHLFGWMVPSGCCGKGCPPVGCYEMTYADQPEYIDSRDTQLYAAQGYNMPVTVPLAPNVRHAYNYSSGMPASRITKISNYNPQTSARRMPHQSW